MEQYDVKGMSCAACSARVERAVLGVEGVTSCSVSLLTNSMSVEGNADAETVIDAVRRAGYEASIKGASPHADAQTDTESKRLLKRFIASAAVLLLLMYLQLRSWLQNLPL